MAPIECPRCVAERRARWARASMNTLALLTIAIGVLPCVGAWSVGGAMDAPWAYTVRGAMRADALGRSGASGALLLACGVWALHAVARRLARRASTPLPPPPADPLATCREAPTECPRHRFAR